MWEARGCNKDPLGIQVGGKLQSEEGRVASSSTVRISPDAAQGRRVAVFEPSNMSLTAAPGGRDNIAVVRRCNASAPTQAWTFTNRTQPGPPTMLFQAPCNASSAEQNWTFAGDGTLRAADGGGGLCVTANLQAGCLAALKVTACAPGNANQQWTLLPGGQIASSANPGQCFGEPCCASLWGCCITLLMPCPGLPPHRHSIRHGPPSWYV